MKFCRDENLLLPSMVKSEIAAWGPYYLGCQYMFIKDQKERVVRTWARASAVPLL